MRCCKFAIEFIVIFLNIADAFPSDGNFQAFIVHVLDAERRFILEKTGFL